jgi:predicted SprT family Zn-dependent metalloprotease
MPVKLAQTKEKQRLGHGSSGSAFEQAQSLEFNPQYHHKKKKKKGVHFSISHLHLYRNHLWISVSLSWSYSHYWGATWLR